MDCRVEIPVVPERQVALPPSKSLAARVLMINALGGGTWKVERGRWNERCDDIDIMEAAITSGDDHIDVGASGTAMRFLTAYFACREGRVITLDGSPRMRQRPIGALVDALRQMGAGIEYLGDEGFPPLKIEGRNLHGGTITMRGDVSSQFVSALLMVAPLAGGVTLTLEGDVVSRPYIDMTIALMRRYGIETHWRNSPFVGTRTASSAKPQQSIVVPAGQYIAKPLEIEGDWSAASYWFAMKALLPESRIVLSPLRRDSLQGDRAIVEIMAPLGVKARFLEEDKVTLSYSNCHTPPLSPSILEGELASAATADKARLVPTYIRDMAATPDLVPTLAVTLCLLRVPFTLTGVATLRLKESDRLDALREELARLGYIIEISAGTMSCDGNHFEVKGEITLDSHGDHRMAMALSLAATRHPGITIKDAEVVSKSYPSWWKQLLKK